MEPLCLACGRELLPPYQGKRWCRNCKKWYLPPDDRRVAWPFAKHLAAQIVEELTPFCDRIEVAGSIRRRKETVKDIEVLVIPKYGEQPLDLFGVPMGSQPDHLADYLWDSPLWQRRLSQKGAGAFGPLNKLMLRKADTPELPEWMPVDVFTGTEANWGRDLWVRTGPAMWNTETALRAQRLGGHMHAYGGAAFTRGAESVTCPDEASFAAWLGVPLLPPQLRTDEAARNVLAA